MLVLFVDDTFGGKVDAGTDVQINVSGVRIVISTGLPDSSIATFNTGLTTTAAAIMTGVTGEFAQISNITIVNTGASTRIVTLYLERADATPDFAAADVWALKTLLANEYAEWTPAGWIQYDSAGRAYGSNIPATQSDQETGTSTTTFVSPAVQHFHLSAAKAFGFTTGAGTPVLAAPSYNITSITDTAAGRLTVTIATDFSSANWIGAVTATNLTNANRLTCLVSKAAGTVILEAASATTTLADPGVGWDWAFYGDL